MFRVLNEQMRALNEAFAAMTDTFAIACECADTDCIATIDIRPEDYLKVRAEPRHFVVLADHVLPNVEYVTREADQYVVVEKIDTAGEIAEALDPQADSSTNPNARAQA